MTDNIWQNPSDLKAQTHPPKARQQGFIAPSPVFPSGGAGSGPNEPFQETGTGNLTVTDGIHSVSGVTNLDFTSGATVGGTSPNATVNITGAGFTPVAGQMTLTADVNWGAQAGVPTNLFWPPFNSLATVIAPAFNPDGIASLTTPVPAVVSIDLPPGPTWPGFTAPATGIYHLQSSIQLTSSLGVTLEDNLSVVIVIWNPDGSGGVLKRIDRNWQGSLGGGVGFEAYTLDASGLFNLTAGQVAFTFLDTRTHDGGANYAVAGFSFFGCHRVR